MLVLSLIISLTFLMILHQAATGTGHFICRQSYNCSYQVYISIRGKKITFYPKSCLRTTAFSFCLRRFLVDVPNCSNAHSLEFSTRKIQEWHECGCERMLPFCSRGRMTFSSARQKGKHFASSNIRKKKPTQAWKAVLPDSSRNTAFTLV